MLYDDEVTAVRSAAEAAGLTATGFDAAAGLTLAGAALPPALSADRQLLAELLQIRTSLGRYGVNLNQAVAAFKQRCGSTGVAAAGGRRLCPRYRRRRRGHRDACPPPGLRIRAREQ